MRVEKDFGSRPIQNKKRCIKFFLIFEGLKTEKLYFDGVIKNKNKIDIHNLITIYNISREENNKNISNPHKILFELCADLHEDIKKSDEYYEEENDKICFIFDRDSKSFTDKQYEEVVTECKSKNYNLYISNPYFELWLLLHFDISNITECDICKNEQQTKEKKFIEHTLSQRINHFNPSKLRFDDFIDGIPTAIQNSKKFATDLNGLQDNTGTSISLLFEAWKTP